MGLAFFGVFLNPEDADALVIVLDTHVESMPISLNVGSVVYLLGDGVKINLVIAEESLDSIH